LSGDDGITSEVWMIGVVAQRTDGGASLIDVAGGCLAVFGDSWWKVRFAKAAEKSSVFSSASF
jgi:hypothetical protein